MPITTDLPDVLNIFLINFLDSFSSFSKIEIAYAIAPRFAFVKSENKSTIDISGFFNKNENVKLSHGKIIKERFCRSTTY